MAGSPASHRDRPQELCATTCGRGTGDWCESLDYTLDYSEKTFEYREKSAKVSFGSQLVCNLRKFRRPFLSGRKI